LWFYRHLLVSYVRVEQAMANLKKYAKNFPAVDKA
jgi:hypothetical protein